MTETVDVRGFPPSAETAAYGQQVLPLRRWTPGAVGALDGPDGPLGPELAGALTLTYGAFAEDASAQRGYRHFADMQKAMLSADGFIRWFSFVDGPHGYGLGLWRSVDEASAFVRGAAHRAAVTEQYRNPFEYSQFAGIWAVHTLGRRTMHCPSCGGRRGPGVGLRRVRSPPRRRVHRPTQPSVDASEGLHSLPDRSRAEIGRSAHSSRHERASATAA